MLNQWVNFSNGSLKRRFWESENQAMKDNEQKKGYITLAAKRKGFGITKTVEFSFDGLEELDKIIDLLKQELTEREGDEKSP